MADKTLEVFGAQNEEGGRRGLWLPNGIVNGGRSNDLFIGTCLWKDKVVEQVFVAIDPQNCFSCQHNEDDYCQVHSLWNR